MKDKGIKEQLEDYNGSRLCLMAGEMILNSMKLVMGDDEFNRLMNEPINECKCGFIKKGDNTMCPYCENIEGENNE